MNPPALSSSRWTSARIGLGRTGGSLPFSELLRFRLDHAKARDAVQAPFDPAALASSLAFTGLEILTAPSMAGDRGRYLQRPDLGRRLSPMGHACLSERRSDHDLVIILADGLSATAAHRHGAATIAALIPRLGNLRLAPLVLAPLARVALQDEIGHALGARAALILLGERPGLGVADSLGAYLVRDPKPGNTDACRNCVSNIHPAGLPPDAAGHRIAWLIHESRRLGFTGVDLKDASAEAPLPAPGAG